MAKAHRGDLRNYEKLPHLLAISILIYNLMEENEDKPWIYNVTGDPQLSSKLQYW